jgi:hypothetical protein
MRQHVNDGGLNNQFVFGIQEQRAVTGLNGESLDELKYLIVEFQRASPYFSEVEFELLDRARARLVQLEAEAV